MKIKGLNYLGVVITLAITSRQFQPVISLPKVVLIGAIFEEEFKDSPAELAFK